MLGAKVFVLLLVVQFVLCQEEVENLIIGSGFGGSVAAYRLTQAGHEVTMLERGNWYKIDDDGNTFSTFLQPDGRSAWYRPNVVAPGYSNLPNNITIRPGVFEWYNTEPNPNDPGIARSGTGQQFWAGAAVGGGSVVYNGVLLKPTEEHFDRAFGNEEIYDDLYEELEEYYEKARNILKPGLIPDSILNDSHWLNARVFREQAENAGFDYVDFDDDISYGVAKIPYGIRWDYVRDELDGERTASLISGNLWYGVNSGAKYSTDQKDNYLDRALDTGRLNLKELHNVIEITFDESTERYLVDAQKLSATTGEVIEIVSFSAKKLFVSAGAMGSNTLLTRAKRRSLTNLNEHVGTRFGCNGDSFVVRFANSDGTSTSPDLGAPGAFGVFAYNATGGPIVFFDQNVVWGPVVGLNNLIVQIGMGIPDEPGAGSWSYDSSSDSVSFNWPSGVADANVWEGLTETIAKINDANPGSSGGTESLSELMYGSMHPLGGLPLGYATDLYGRVKGYNNLYVIDASLIPGSTGAVNPVLTTVALAERCMATIIDEDFDNARGSDSSSFILTPAFLLAFLSFLALLL